MEVIATHGFDNDFELGDWGSISSLFSSGLDLINHSLRMIRWLSQSGLIFKSLLKFHFSFNQINLILALKVKRFTESRIELQSANYLFI